MSQNERLIAMVRAAIACWQREQGSFTPFSALTLLPLVSAHAASRHGVDGASSLHIALLLAILHRRGEIIRVRLTDRGGEYVAGLRSAPFGQATANLVTGSGVRASKIKRAWCSIIRPYTRT